MSHKLTNIYVLLHLVLQQPVHTFQLFFFFFYNPTIGWIRVAAMLTNRCLVEEALLCCFMLCACCKPSPCSSFPIPDKLPVLCSQNKHCQQNSLAFRTPEAPLSGVHLAVVSEPASWSSLLFNTGWSEVTCPLFISSASPGTLSRKESTKFCFFQESCSPLFPVSEFCQWHKLMLSQNLSSRF